MSSSGKIGSPLTGRHGRGGTPENDEGSNNNRNTFQRERPPRTLVHSSSASAVLMLDTTTNSETPDDLDRCSSLSTPPRKGISTSKTVGASHVSPVSSGKKNKKNMTVDSAVASFKAWQAVNRSLHDISFDGCSEKEELQELLQLLTSVSVPSYWYDDDEIVECRALLMHSVLPDRWPTVSAAKITFGVHNDKNETTKQSDLTWDVGEEYFYAQLVVLNNLPEVCYGNSSADTNVGGGNCINGVAINAGCMLSIQIRLFHGAIEICKPMMTSYTVSETSARTRSMDLRNAMMISSLLIEDIPRAARMLVAMYVDSGDETDDDKGPVAWANVQIFDVHGCLRQGPIELHMWPGSSDTTFAGGEDGVFVAGAAGTTALNPDPHAVVFSLCLPQFKNPVQFPSFDMWCNLIISKERDKQEANDLVENVKQTRRSKYRKWKSEKQSAADADADSRNDTDSSDDFLDKEGAEGKNNRGTITTKTLQAQHMANRRDIRNRESAEGLIVLEGGVGNPNKLPDHLGMLDWASKNNISYAYSLLASTYSPQTASLALRLLAFDFTDAEVRRYAISYLARMCEDDFLDYCIQLVQSLRMEPHHDSPLARFVLGRAVISCATSDRNENGEDDYSESPVLATRLFWLFRSELQSPMFRERYLLFIEILLRCMGPRAQCQLRRQVQVVRELEYVSITVKLIKKERDLRRIALHQLIKLARLPPTFDLPVLTHMSFTGIDAHHVKALDSKKVPLWLQLESTNPFAVSPALIFKVGDDLRQDMVTLQMVRLMDKLWKENRLDMQLITYDCIATDPNVGMIKAVMNSSTLSTIQGELGGASAVFWEDTLKIWLRKENAKETDYNAAVENFTLSCAGYCVASYVLGIGDRHNDNIMLTNDGRLFHIDFGHFLGNVKRKFGIKRERTPFVLTSDFVKVMGGRDSAHFTKFLIFSCEAFLVLRRNAPLLINLLHLMVSCGLPELKQDSDIDYVRNALFLDMTEDKAMLAFKKLVADCLKGEFSTRLNWFVHQIVHK